MRIRLGLLVAALCTVGASAQEEIGPFTVTTGGWTFVPVVEDDEVSRLLAVREENTPTPGTISGILYEWDAGLAAWGSAAWDGAFHEEMLAFVVDRAALDAEDSFDMFPEELDVDLFLFALAGPVAPIGFSHGLFNDDPLQPVVQVLPEPVLLLQPLEDNGYPAVASVGGGPIGGVVPSDPPVPVDCVRTESQLIHDLIAALNADLAEPGAFWDEFDSTLPAHCQCTFTQTRRTQRWPYPNCSPWAVSGGPFGGALLCTAFCRYSRTASSSRTRTYVWKCTDCTEHTCVQSQSRTSTQSARGPDFSIPQPCVPAAANCGMGGLPTVPCRHRWWTQSTTSWAPPCPEPEGCR